MNARNLAPALVLLTVAAALGVTPTASANHGWRCPSSADGLTYAGSVHWTAPGSTRNHYVDRPSPGYIQLTVLWGSVEFSVYTDACGAHNCDGIVSTGLTSTCYVGYGRYYATVAYWSAIGGSSVYRISTS